MIIKRVCTTYEDSGTGLVCRFEPVEGTLAVKKAECGFEARYLTQDDDPVSPDENGDDNLFLVHYHRDLRIMRDRIIGRGDVRGWYQGGSIDLAESYWIFSVASYIHSDIQLSLGEGWNFPDCRWDVSHVGLVLASKEEWPDNEKAQKAAQALIEEWNQYLSGDVYCAVRETFDRDKIPTGSYDICGGYSGLEYALSALKTDL